MNKIRRAGHSYAIRQRPQLYLGERSLSALNAFMHGYSAALRAHSITKDNTLLLPQDFHDWVAYRLRFRESTKGFTKMILDRAEDESAALGLFFRLLDEYEKRNPRIVAKLPECRWSHYHANQNLPDNLRPSHIPMVLLVSYTDDPGFFILAEPPDESLPKKGFCRSLRQFETNFKVGRDTLEVVDSDIYGRLLKEDRDYRSKKDVL